MLQQVVLYIGKNKADYSQCQIDGSQFYKKSYAGLADRQMVIYSDFDQIWLEQVGRDPKQGA
ncbi:hypothetical protein D3C76_1295030 [compost metagenome]